MLDSPEYSSGAPAALLFALHLRNYFMNSMKWLEEKEWQKSFELVPRVAVDLVIEKNGQILLTKRARKPFAGHWHLPGSFIARGEGMEACARRVGREELGVEVRKLRQVGVFENLVGDPRGHVIDVVYRCELEDEPRAVGDTAEVGWFSKLPENVGFGQKEMLKKLGI
jgi:ADP-ribose pyrophosphatase YjhB (NUDIX family)